MFFIDVLTVTSFFFVLKVEEEVCNSQQQQQLNYFFLFGLFISILNKKVADLQQILSIFGVLILFKKRPKIYSTL